MDYICLYTYTFSKYDNCKKDVDVLKRVTDKGEDYRIDIRSKFEENGQWRHSYGVRLNIAEFREMTEHMPQGEHHIIESDDRRIIFEPCGSGKYRLKVQSISSKDKEYYLYMSGINRICFNKHKIINATMKA